MRGWNNEIKEKENGEETWKKPRGLSCNESGLLNLG